MTEREEIIMLRHFLYQLVDDASETVYESLASWKMYSRPHFAAWALITADLIKSVRKYLEIHADSAKERDSHHHGTIRTLAEVLDKMQEESQDAYEACITKELERLGVEGYRAANSKSP